MAEMKYRIQIRRSSRKTLSVQIVGSDEVLVRAPLRMPEGTIRRFLEEKRPWIEAHLEKVARREEAARLQPLSMEEIQALAEDALRWFPPRVRDYARILGVRVGRITIRNQKTRWGSCSAQGNLNFNCLLMLCPENVRDYVIVHELCHRLELNHSPRFWALVEGAMPDFRERRAWLKANGPLLLARMTAEQDVASPGKQP